MSGFEVNMTGIMSRNDRKDRDTQPDFKGNATVDGTDYWIDAWVQERKDGSGRKFFKLKFKAKDQPQNGDAKPRANVRDDLSDLPF
jgi:hypothetical protein